MSAVDRNTLARRHLDSAESWLRKIVHTELEKVNGADYILNNSHLPERLKEQVRRRFLAGGYARQVDATTFTEIIHIVCNSYFFSKAFVSPLKRAYPLGREEAWYFLQQLHSIRNNLSHGRGCSARELEKSVCYSNDLSDSLKAYFRERNMEKTFNVPLFVKYEDNLGNRSDLIDVPSDINSRIIDWRVKGNGDLRPGDNLLIEVEVDPSFDPAEYNVTWQLFARFAVPGTKAEIRIANEHVGEQLEIRFELVTKNDWHRAFGRDDALVAIFRVLPPL